MVAYPGVTLIGRQKSGEDAEKTAKVVRRVIIMITKLIFSWMYNRV